jgi:hypothetical protein
MITRQKKDNARTRTEGRRKDAKGIPTTAAIILLAMEIPQKPGGRRRAETPKYVSSCIQEK